VDLPLLERWISGVLLLSLRIAPLFSFAPPFTLVRVPALFKLLFGIALAAALLSTRPALYQSLPLDVGSMVLAGARELMVGLVFVLAFQIVFGAIYFVGRTIDVQAGFGLSLLIDPGSGARAPMVGTIFAFLAGMLFFAMNGHHDLLRIVSASIDAIPLGQGGLPASPRPMLGFIALMFLTAVGVGGGIILSLFLVDLTIAMLSRTVPQMNVLVLGFQVKAMVLLAALPLTLSLSAVLLARMMRITLETLPRLL
jgi:flagellar biosynthetic protein FliR